MSILVANTDRHHENWALLLTDDRSPQLAPSFDHASSLGFQLSDDERQDRLDTTDSGRTVEAFARRGRSRHFAGSPSLVGLAARMSQSARTFGVRLMTENRRRLLDEFDRPG